MWFCIIEPSISSSLSFSVCSETSMPNAFSTAFSAVIECDGLHVPHILEVSMFTSSHSLDFTIVSKNLEPSTTFIYAFLTFPLSILRFRVACPSIFVMWSIVMLLILA